MSDAAFPEAPIKYSDPWYAKPGVICFIAAGWPTIISVKVGVTTRDGLLRRLRSIQSANHEHIHILRVIDFTEGEKPLRTAELREREIHRQFSHLQRTSSGNVGSEWFRAAPELMTFLEIEGKLLVEASPPLPNLKVIEDFFCPTVSGG